MGSESLICLKATISFPGDENHDKVDGIYEKILNVVKTIQTLPMDFN